MLYLLLLLNCLLFLILAIYQLKHYYFPYIQRLSLRIVLIIPLYSILSFIRFYYPDSSIFCNLVRDTYESFVLFYYFRFIVYCLGNERNYYHLRFIKEKGEIQGMPMIRSNLLIHNDSVVLLSDYIIHEFLSIKFGIFQYCVCMPFSSIIQLLIECTSDTTHFSFVSTIYYLIIFIQNVSIMYCLYKLASFLKLINFVHPNYAKVFLILKSLIGILFWQRFAVNFIPDAIVKIACDAVNIIIATNECDGYVLLAAVEIFEYTIFGIVFYFIFHPKTLAEMVLIHYKEITVPQEEPQQIIREYTKTTLPFFSTRFPLQYALKDAIGFHDVVLDIQNINKVYKSDAFTEAEKRIHISKQRRLQRRRSRLPKDEEKTERNVIVHFDDDFAYVKEEDEEGSLKNLIPKIRQLEKSSSSLNHSNQDEPSIEFDMSTEDEQLYQYAKRIGGYGYYVIEDGHVQL
eukprot:NODE_592_length_5620_cov_0.720884.p1 type:complete len:458 gc:universal NODE_592_length_5620_cov_0.720884:3718-2345(-)